MNERIQKLHDQAFRETSDYYATIQRFAELIARECVHLCIEELPDPRDTPEGLCAKRIVKHFGIKE